MKAISDTDGIGNGATAFDGGNGGDRLAKVNETKVNAYIKATCRRPSKSTGRPSSSIKTNGKHWQRFDALVRRQQGRAGRRAARGRARISPARRRVRQPKQVCQKQQPSCGASGQVYSEVNSAGNCATTDGKWTFGSAPRKSLKVPDMGATGMQAPGRGVATWPRQYRPSCNSMMNSLFGESVDTSFNSAVAASADGLSAFGAPSRRSTPPSRPRAP